VKVCAVQHFQGIEHPTGLEGEQKNWPKMGGATGQNLNKATWFQESGTYQYQHRHRHHHHHHHRRRRHHHHHLIVTS